MGHIKLWENLLDCPKVHRLSDVAFRCWVKLLVTALRNGGRNGELPSLDMLVFRMRMPAELIELSVQEMHRCLLLESCPNNPIGGMPYRIHDWDHWQASKDSQGAIRQARWRDRQASRNALHNGVTNGEHNAQRDGVEGLKVEGINTPPTPRKRGERKPYGSVFAEGRPENIPSELWTAYIEVRKHKRAADTPRALAEVIAELDKFQAEGQDPAESVRRSVRSSWTDVYPVRSNAGAGQAVKPAPVAGPVGDPEARARAEATWKRKRADPK